MVAPYNVVPELDDRVACVIVEPVAANMGLVAPAAGFLEGLRAACDAAGALLIFDEVITGFRLGEGGATGWSGVRPDLWCFGKVIGGGLPVGAFGGRADVLASLAPDGPVYQAGTLSGNPLATAAGLAVLRPWTPASYAALSARVARFGAALAEVLADRPGQGRPRRRRGPTAGGPGAGGRTAVRALLRARRLRPGRATTTAPWPRRPPACTRAVPGHAGPGRGVGPRPLRGGVPVDGPRQRRARAHARRRRGSHGRRPRPLSAEPPGHPADVDRPEAWHDERDGPEALPAEGDPAESAVGLPIAAQPDTGPAPSKVREADVFRFEDVDRPDDQGHHRRGRRKVLTLVFASEGIEITGPGARSTELLTWSEVLSVGVGPARTDPDGRVETPIEVVSASGPMPFVIHSDGPLVIQTDALEEQVVRWSTPSSAPPQLVVPLSALAAAVAAEVPPDLAPFTGPPVPWQAQPVPSLRTRTRRPTVLVAAVVLLVAAAGLAFGLSASGRGGTTKPASVPTTVPLPVSSDLALARQLMLTRNDLPAGWRAARDESGSSSSLTVQRGQSQITKTLAGCMGITEAQAAIVLGGRAPDQTAQAASPIFVAPTSASRPGSALEIQTTASIVRTHADEQSDFALFSNPHYPACMAAASASQIQLGVDETTGRGDRPSSPTVSPVDLPGPAGVQTSGLIVAFDVLDGSSRVPVEVEAVSVGGQRIEGQLQVFSIGGQIPDDVLVTSVSEFQKRVADGGGGSAV